MFNVRPEKFSPWIRFKPPSNDPPGFRMAADGSIRGSDDSGLGFRGYNSSANTAPSLDIGFGEYNTAGSSNPFGFIAPYTPATDPIPSFDGESLPPLPTAPLFPQMTEPQLLWPSLQGYDGDLGTRPETPVPGFHVEPPADDTPGFRVVADGPTQGAFEVTPQIGPFEYGLRTDAAPPIEPGSDYMSRPADNGVHPTLHGTLDPPYLPRPLRAPVQEALDQIAKIYAGVRASPGGLFDRQGSNTSSVMLRGGFGDGLVPAVSEVLDPQHILPTQGGGWRPPPDHNKPRPLPKPTPDSSRPQQPLPPRTQGTQVPPDTAPAAAVAETATRERAATFDTHRRHLQELDPDSPLLKLEPVPGVTPDQATVDSFGKEVRRIVGEKVDRTVEGLSAQSTYEQRSIVRTIRGDVDLRAEFERLKTAGKRVDGGGGQYGRDGELYELPGGVRVGFRMANDMRTGEKSSVPTLDIRYPGRKRITFHYNNQR